MNSVIETVAITKYFGRKCAVDQVSLSVPRGSVFALLGRNGSGKSTLIQMILGLLDPTRGSATVLGNASASLNPETLGRVAYVPEGHPTLNFMRVRDLQSFQRSFYPKWNDSLCRTIIDHFGLSDTQKVSQLSRGQKAGVALALAIAPEPELLIMDDPALGLDPVARRNLLEAMILITRNAGNTIFFTSHILDDVERVADHIGILDRSELRVSCSLDTLRQRVKRFVVTVSNPDRVPAIPGLLQSRREGSELHLTVANVNGRAMEAIQSLAPSNVAESTLTLEDMVIGYLGDRGHQVSLLDKTRMNAEVA